MRHVASLLLLVLVACSPSSASIVTEVRAAAQGGDSAEAERLISEYRQTSGLTPELAAAISWAGRGALAAQDLEAAERFSEQAHEASLKLLATHSLQDDKRLQTALGAAIEVQGQLMAGRGELSEAIAFLTGELERWRDTPIRTRLQKNINLISLAGKPAPPLELTRYLGPQPAALSKLRGKVLLLFFWAHWCPDCKFEAPVLARLAEEYSERGLVIIGPTKLYGFAARGSEATPERELAYIDEMRKSQYGDVANMTVPVSEENFANYGSSTTPTIVLVDRQGIVRLYHPGEMPYEELAPKVAELL
jgi:thiol-disulfide isomerase/thioredoxin